MQEVLPGRSTERPWQDFSLVERAWTLSAEIHRAQFRKAGTIPYLAHLWSVAALVLEHGGDDTQEPPRYFMTPPRTAGESEFSTASPPS